MPHVLDISQQEIDHISVLSNRHYSNNTMLSNATPVEKAEFDRIRRKFEELGGHFARLYNIDYGPFYVDGISANPMNRAGTKLKGFWMGICKGASNKQYAAQISFVVNTNQRSLDVGFYFGSAESQGAPSELTRRIRLLGRLLAREIGVKNSILREAYLDALEFGFRTYSRQGAVSSITWENRIAYDPVEACLIYQLFPVNGTIELDRIAFCVAMVINFMNAIPDSSAGVAIRRRMREPLTQEQRQLINEMKAEIGRLGEEYIMGKEKQKLLDWGLTEGPRQVSLESDSFGYDIESIEKIGTEFKKVYIEVKTTTLALADPISFEFFISSSEYEFYEGNKDDYRLYRVFNVKVSPSEMLVNMKDIHLRPTNYQATINLKKPTT